MSGILPYDLLIDVLTRLPIKSVVRCACVCKSWYSLVTNPSFINTHLNNNKKNLLLIRNRSGDDGNGVNYSLLRCENEMLCDYAELELPLKSRRNPVLRIMGSCNGLVCLSDDLRIIGYENGLVRLSNDLHCYREELYLWNPSIRKTMALPPLPVTFQSQGRFMHNVGFGYDSLTDDYKVVKLVYLDGDIDFKTSPEVYIFSLSIGTWRNISYLGLPYIISDLAPHAYLKGAAHWLAKDPRRRSNFFNLIVSFHMGDEVFGEIMLPSSMLCADRLPGVCVGKFQESLSLIHIRRTGRTGDKKTCCIWVMREYGISESWTKQFNIDMSGGLFKSVAGITRIGEVLFRTKAGYLVAYDPKAKRVMHLHNGGSIDRWSRYSFYVDAYTESLVLLGAKFCSATCEESPVLHGEENEVKSFCDARFYLL